MGKTYAVILSGLGWILCFFLSFSHLFGQEITLKGTIIDGGNDLPLEAVSVVAPEFSKGTLTNNQGEYELMLDPGELKIFELVYFLNGFDSILFTVDVKKAEEGIWRQDLILYPIDYATDDVVITATKGFEQRQADVTVSVDVIKPAQIRLLTTADLTTVLRQSSGIDILDDQINIRGSSGFASGVGSRVTLMLNGLPLLTSDASRADLRLLPIDNVSKIEVIKGASSVLYGSSALGGVINVITQDPGEKPITIFRYRQAFFNSPKFKALDWDGSSSAYEASAHLFHSRRVGDLDLSVQTNFIKESGYIQDTELEEFRGFLMMKYRPKSVPGLNFGLNISGRVDSGSNVLFWRSYFPDTTTIISQMDTLTKVVGGALTPTLGTAGVSRRLRTRISLDPFLQYTSSNGHLLTYRGRYFRNTSANNTNQSSQNWIFYNDVNFQTSILNNVSWITGMTLINSGVNGEEVFGGEFVLEGDTIQSDGTFTSRSFGLYTQVDGKFGRLNTNLGVRVENIKVASLDDETRSLFRVGLNYEIRRGTNIRGSFGQGFRVPSVAERFTTTEGGGVLVEPNPDIKTESGYSTEIGIRQGFRIGGEKARILGFADVAGFQMRFEDMVEFGIQTRVFFPVPDVRFSTVNIADARIRGIEVNFGLDAKWNKWRSSFTAGATFMDPINLNGVSDEKLINIEERGILDLLDTSRVDQPRFLKYRSRWLIRSSVTASYQNISLTTNLRFRSYQRNIDQYLFLVIQEFDVFRKKHPRGEAVVDLIFSYSINKKHTLTFNTSNVFNQEYAILPGTLAEQRKFTLQYSLTL